MGTTGPGGDGAAEQHERRDEPDDDHQRGRDAADQPAATAAAGRRRGGRPRRPGGAVGARAVAGLGRGRRARRSATARCSAGGCAGAGGRPDARVRAARRRMARPRSVPARPGPRVGPVRRHGPRAGQLDAGRRGSRLRRPGPPRGDHGRLPPRVPGAAFGRCAVRAPSITGRVTDRPVARWAACRAPRCRPPRRAGRRAPWPSAARRLGERVRHAVQPAGRARARGGCARPSPRSPRRARRERRTPDEQREERGAEPVEVGRDGRVAVHEPLGARCRWRWPAPARPVVTVTPGSREMPKSPSAGSAKRDMRTLAGLTSRCRIPARCAVSSAPATQHADVEDLRPRQRPACAPSGRRATRPT